VHLVVSDSVKKGAFISSCVIGMLRYNMCRGCRSDILLEQGESVKYFRTCLMHQ
jgi:hypothetical protein